MTALGGKKKFRPRPDWTIPSHINSHRITRPMPSMRALISLVRPEYFNRKNPSQASVHSGVIKAWYPGHPVTGLLIGDLYSFVTCFSRRCGTKGRLTRILPAGRCE